MKSEDFYIERLRRSMDVNGVPLLTSECAEIIIYLKNKKSLQSEVEKLRTGAYQLCEQLDIKQKEIDELHEEVDYQTMVARENRR